MKVDYRPFAEPDLARVMALTRAEGWPSYASDPERTRRALTAPGVRCLVASVDGEVAGWAQALTDGETTTYLALLVVAPAYRGQGVGRGLVAEVFRACGVARIDLLAEPDSEAFYRRLPHRAKPGYRLYRDARESSPPSGTIPDRD